MGCTQGLAANRPAGQADRDGVALLRWPELRRVLAVGVAGFLCGFATPGGYRTVGFALGTLSSSRIQSLIVEWSSPFRSLETSGSSV